VGSILKFPDFSLTLSVFPDFPWLPQNSLTFHDRRNPVQANLSGFYKSMQTVFSGFRRMDSRQPTAVQQDLDSSMVCLAIDSIIMSNRHLMKTGRQGNSFSTRWWIHYCNKQRLQVEGQPFILQYGRWHASQLRCCPPKQGQHLLTEWLISIIMTSQVSLSNQ